MKQDNSRQGSLKNFFEWNYLKLKNYARRQLGGPAYEADAEDLLQEVAVSLFTHHELDSTISNLAAYIYRAIRNRITDQRRKKKHEIAVGDFTDEKGNDLFMFIPDDAPFEAVLEGLDDGPPPDLYRAMAQLSRDERELIIENSIHGRTFAELSEAWGISQGTLLSRKYRALQKLHKILTTQTD